MIRDDAYTLSQNIITAIEDLRGNCTVTEVQHLALQSLAYKAWRIYEQLVVGTKEPMAADEARVQIGWRGSRTGEICTVQRKKEAPDDFDRFDVPVYREECYADVKRCGPDTESGINVSTKRLIDSVYRDKGDEFWGVEMTDEGSRFKRTGLSGVTCTGFAVEIFQRNMGCAKIYGFDSEENPTSMIAALAGGHDFAVLEDRYIVDPWLTEVESGEITIHGGMVVPVNGQLVFDLNDPEDEKIITELYGDRSKWRRMPKLEADTWIVIDPGQRKATEQAEACIQSMDSDGWAAKVTNNCGWTWSISNGPLTVHPDKKGDFFCMFGDPIKRGRRNTESFEDPNEAVRVEIEQAHRWVEELAQLLEKCDEIIDLSVPMREFRGYNVRFDWPNTPAACQLYTTAKVIGEDKEYPRVKYGDEIGECWDIVLPNEVCPDCIAIEGEFHALGCQREECPKCHGVFTQCACKPSATWNEEQ